MLGDVAQQTAHDLARAGLGKLGREHDARRPGDLANPLRHVGSQLVDQVDRALVAADQADVRDDRLAGVGIRPPAHGGLGHAAVVDERALDLDRRVRWAETFITSSTRPINQKSPSSSIRAPSPAKYIPGNRLQYVST
jgi:hypothetical protein